MAKMELVPNIKNGLFEVKNFKELKDTLAVELEKYSRAIVLDDEKLVDTINQEIVSRKLMLKAELADTASILKKNQELNALAGFDLHLNENSYVLSLNQAKKEKARLNSIAKAFNDERIKIEKEYMEAFNVGKDQVKQIVDDIKNASNKIDTLVDYYDNKYIEYKKELIAKNFEKINDCKDLTLEMIFDEKWLLKGSRIEAVYAEMRNKYDKFLNDYDTLKQSLTYYTPETKHLATQKFFQTLDLAQALNEALSIARGVEKVKQEEIKEEIKTDASTSDFKIMKLELVGSEKSFIELIAFLKDKNITYKKI